MKSTTTFSKIKTEFTLKHATSHAGIKPFLDFLNQIGFTAALGQIGCHKKGNSLFPLSRILLVLIIGWTLGCERLFHFRLLRDDNLLQRFIGRRLPHHTLLNKELLRLGKSDPQLKTQLQTLHHQVIAPLLPQDLILDFDSTVETVYGDQAGAAVGVNAHKRGRKSYHPLLVYEAQSRACLHAVLRPGNVHSSNGVIDFAQEAMSGLPQEKSVKFARFDKGFGGEAFYAFWEQQGIGYAGKIKWTKRLQQEVARCTVWKRFVDEDIVIEGIRLWYQATSWEKARLVTVIRKADRYEGDQLQLVDLLWEYEAIVTSLDWEAIDIFRFYNQRACMENLIKEAKYGFSIHRIATSQFEANEIDLLIKLLAYNLFERFKAEVGDPVHRGFTIRRFRQTFFQAAGVLVQHSRQTTLRITDSFASRYAWERMMRKVVMRD